MRRRGFTLIELLIVIAIIAILAAVIFVALDPLRRFQDSRDSARWQDVSALVQAIAVDQIDNGGSYLNAIATTTLGEVYMIGDCTSQASGSLITPYCETDPTISVCVHIDGLVNEGYLTEIPISPVGEGPWDADYTGYTLERVTSSVRIRACEAENSTEILIAQ